MCVYNTFCVSFVFYIAEIFMLKTMGSVGQSDNSGVVPKSRYISLSFISVGCRLKLMANLSGLNYNAVLNILTAVFSEAFRMYRMVQTPNTVQYSFLCMIFSSAG